MALEAGRPVTEIGFDPMSETIWQAFAATVGRDRTAPLFTYYDDGSGDRTELSGATLDNWVAKTANLLADGAGLATGDTVAVLLPPHWQTAAILLGAWTAGLAADLDGPPHPVDALFTTPERAATAAAWPTTDRYATSLAPLAAPLRNVPPGYVDYVVEIRAFGDRFVPVQPVTGADRAIGERDHREVCQTAAARATQLGITAGDRVLVDASVYPDPADWLLAPLVAGASVVLCAHLDSARLPSRAETEQVTVTLA
jgi:uncharacterized protein (TIGR03089 family)